MSGAVYGENRGEIKNLTPDSENTGIPWSEGSEPSLLKSLLISGDRNDIALLLEKLDGSVVVEAQRTTTGCSFGCGDVPWP